MNAGSISSPGYGLKLGGKSLSLISYLFLIDDYYVGLCIFYYLSNSQIWVYHQNKKIV